MPPKPKTFELRFPAMGVVRRIAHERVASAISYPTPWAVNVRLEDSLTSRLRGGSWVGIAPTSANLVTENGDQIVTEIGSNIILGPNSSIPPVEYIYLVTENGDNIVTESVDPIVLGPQYSVVGGDARHWSTPGGDAPTRGTADCVYRDRLLRVDGNAVYASRVGKHADWNYGKDVSDTLRATVFQFSESNEVGGNVLALVPHKDSNLLVFTVGETWVQQGDPLTGSRRNVSREVGVIASRAWCKNHDTIYFLSSRGLYSVGADGSGLKPLSEDKIPEDLAGIDDDDCVLAYNHADRGVYIHRWSGSVVSWFYDTARDNFWAFDTSSTDSHVLIGPIRLGGPDAFGLIQRLHGIMAAGSTTIVWRIVPGETAEEACDNGKSAITAALAGSDFDEYISASGAWDAGRSKTAWPRTRSMWCCIWLSSEGDWAYESVHLTAIPFGQWR